MPRTCMCCASSAPNCKTLVAVGACAINGGLPAQRNHLDLGKILREVYCTQTGISRRQPDSQRPGAAAAAEPGAPDP
jgi:coenzyme F420-reducing hydrogenase gamma subunit